VLQRRAPDAVAPPRGEPTRQRHPLGIFVPADGPMAQVHRLVEHVAASSLSVLVLGETGTGKEVVAEAIHRFSKRAKGPFVRLNCAALPETLLESELFGHEKGAFTGAIASKPGLVEAADGGTLFLDEMGELPLLTQAKLLRVLEAREVQRLGSVVPKKVDLRIVAATNVDLEAAVRQGKFRLDLYHRLDGVSIAIPPLRARKAEILPLARLFLAKACEAEGIAAPAVTSAAEQALVAHAWPGNVRELRNVVARAAVLAGGSPITPVHLRLGHDVAAPSTAAADEAGGDGERERVLAVLDRCGGNQSRAARELGIPRRTLLRRLDEYGVPRPRK
jgi:DNA-binding NtrC family response regulator